MSVKQKSIAGSRATTHRRRDKDGQAHASNFKNKSRILNLSNFTTESCYHKSIFTTKKAESTSSQTPSTKAGVRSSTLWASRQKFQRQETLSPLHQIISLGIQMRNCNCQCIGSIIRFGDRVKLQ